MTRVPVRYVPDVRSRVRLASAITIALVFAAGIHRTDAACAVSRPLDTGYAYLVSNPDWGGAGGSRTCAFYGCYESESGPPISPDMLGVFWALGAGDPAVGLGVDNGSWDSSNWIKQHSVPFSEVYHYPAWMTRSDMPYYGQPGVPPNWLEAGDGCVTDLGTPGVIDVALECTAVLLTDQWDNRGYFAVLSNYTDAGGAFDLTPSTLDPGGAPTIKLGPIPAPHVSQLAVQPDGDFELDVIVPVPTQGVYENGGCGALAGYRVWTFLNPSGAMAPSDRSTSSGWVLADAIGGGPQSVTPLGATAQVVIPCGSSQMVTDVYLATQLVFDSGFATPMLSANAIFDICPDYLMFQPSCECWLGPSNVPPTVVEVVPTRNALDIPAATNVTVTFSEPVFPSSVNTGSFRLLSGGSPVPATVSVATSSLRATLDPLPALSTDTLYSVEINAGVTDLEGLSAEPFSSPFRTAAAAGGSESLPSASEPTSGIAAEARTGTAVAEAGDLDGDGIGDWIAGAPSYQASAGPVEAGAGAVYLGSTDPTERTTPDILFVGESAHDRVGVSVAGGFDFNGDGRNDVLIGAEQVNRTPDDDLAAGCNAGDPCGNGKVYLIFFDPTDATHYPNLGDPALPDSVNLALVGQSGGVPGVVFEGVALGDQAGFAVAGGGTFLAGAGTDIAIGAPGMDPGGRIDAGEVYVVFNSSALSGNVALARLSSGLPDQVPGKAFRGASAGDRLGFSVAFLPGDGAAKTTTGKLAMGAPGSTTTPGEVVVSPEDPDTTPIVVDSIGDTEPGFRIIGDEAGELLGWSVSSGGDSLADGISDLLIGAPGYDAASQPDAGRVLQTTGVIADGVYSAADVGTTLGGAIWNGAATGDGLGSALTGVGDVTGDGYDDIALGAPFVDPLIQGTPQTDAGAVYLIDGSAATGPLGTLSIADVGTVIAGESLVGTEAGENAGASIAGTGDIDGNGDSDFVVGAPNRDVEGDSESGTVYLITNTEAQDPSACDAAGCTVSDLTTGAEIAVPAGSLPAPATITVTGLLDPALLPSPPPVGLRLLGAAKLEPDGLSADPPLPTLWLPVVSTYASQLLTDPPEVFTLYHFDGAGWVDSGRSGAVDFAPQYPTAISLSATISALHLYAAFIADQDGDGRRDSLDNCPAAANPDQSDTDFDRRGDVCDCDGNNAYCSTDCTDSDGDGYCVTTDCDDASFGAHPGSLEVCDAVDNNCDGFVDDTAYLLDRLTDPDLTSSARFGSSVARTDDADGDGVDDILVGAPEDVVDGIAEAGTATLFSGRTGTAIHVFIMPEGQPANGDHFGSRVRRIGDLNADGIGEILIGAEFDDGKGRAFVFSGSGLQFLPPALEDSSGENGDRFGYDLSGIGDVTGDGTPDVVVGARGANDSQGSAIVFSGATRLPVAGLSRLEDVSGGAGDLFGYSTTGIADVTGDGVADILVGAYGANSVHLFSGAARTLERTLTGPAGSQFGRGLGAADLDLDGYEDILVGAPGYDDPTLGADVGRVFIYSGRSLDLVGEASDPEGASDDWLGYRVVPIPDVNGDAVQDFLVGVLRDDTVAGSDAGSAILFSGATMTGLRKLIVPDTNVPADFGVSVAGLDDLDADGLPELAVGAFSHAPVPGAQSGSVFIYSGAPASDTDGDSEPDLCDDDDDGDGVPDVADCSPQDASTHPGAYELNDGEDNTCGGYSGFGLIDEISGQAGFNMLGDKETYSWPTQDGATIYEVARADRPDFAVCTTFAQTADESIVDPVVPPSGMTYFYLVRPVLPHAGSWGADSADEERFLSCGP